MSGFMSDVTALAAGPLDPAKRVKYNLGMVLGVDDFDQEYVHLSGRDEWAARDLIGYGTVVGLRVTSETDAKGPRVLVASGVALNPRGKPIRVAPAQCAYLNDWLAAHQADVIKWIGSPLNNAVTLYVTLCYRECPTDNVPIPGEPCRTENEATVASRMADDFQLELRLVPPDQTEEDALRAFVAWFDHITISDAPTSFADARDFIDTLRQAAPFFDLPPSASPVSPLDVPNINTAEACEYLRTAFRIWVTEFRAFWRAHIRYVVQAGDRLATLAGKFNVTVNDLTQLNAVTESTLSAGRTLVIPKGQSDGTPPDEECVLLAQLTVPLTPDLQVTNANDIVIDEARRPFVVHVRMLQEWLLCGRHPSGTGGGASIVWSTTVTSETTNGLAPDPGTALTASRGDHTHGSPALPSAPQPGNSVSAETGFGLPANAGASADYSRADHTHGTPNAPTMPQPGNTVFPETNFGQFPSVGTAPDYSRSDHSHGTPTNPIIASGQFNLNGNPIDPTGNPSVATNGLMVKPIPQFANLFYVTFTGFDPTSRLVLKGTGINILNNPSAVVFEVLLPLLDGALTKVLQTNGLNPKGGFVVRLNLVPKSDFRPLGFMIEISQF